MAFSPNIKLDIQYPAGREPVLFRSAARGRNDIQFALKNTGPDALTLKAGATKLTLTVMELCNQAEAAEVTLAAPGWIASGGLMLSPVADIAWGPGVSLVFSLSFGALGLKAKLGQKHVQAALKNFVHGADTIASKSVDSYVILVDKPAEPDPARQLSKALSFEISPGTVLTSIGRDYRIPNELAITIRNRNKDKPLYAGNAPAGTPVFTLVFPAAWVEPGDEAHFVGTTALTTTALVRDIEVTSESDPDYGWTVLEPGPDSLVTELQPKPENHRLIDRGGALRLRISDLSTNLPPFATQVYVLYEGFDGYDPGYEMLTLTREIPEPQVRSFLADPQKLLFGDACRVSWSVLGCDRIELSYFQDQKLRTLTSDGHNASLSLPEGSLTVVLDENETEDYICFTLSLHKGGMPVLEQEVRVPVVLPLMTLAMSPPAAAAGERALLSWELIGPWAFKGTLTEGRRVLQKITKPASDNLEESLRGSMPEEVRENRFYRLSGTWETPRRLNWTREATLTVVEPVTSIEFFRMYRTIDRPFGEVSFAWSARNAEGYRIGHCAAGTFPGAENLGTLVDDDLTIDTVFTEVMIDWSSVSNRANVRFVDLGLFFDEPGDSIEWFNERLAERDFFLMAFDQNGTSAVPAILQAEVVPRNEEL